MPKRVNIGGNRHRMSAILERGTEIGDQVAFEAARNVRSYGCATVRKCVGTGARADRSASPLARNRGPANDRTGCADRGGTGPASAAAAALVARRSGGRPFDLHPVDWAGRADPGRL